MTRDMLEVIGESKSLNSKLFSLIRIQIMSSLAELGRDGSSYRELKAVLNEDDGVLNSNLKALEGMGYIESKDVKIEQKNLKSYNITTEGEIAWNVTRIWLKKMLECGDLK
ncbi:MAG: transcriptional regulator [Methanomassiliicoccales archaeon]|jgi:DNA-binding MarR family transcriptional regulator